MKTKMDRVPVGLSELVETEAKKRKVPKTFVYSDIENSMRIAGDIKKMFQRKKKDEPLFRF